MVQPRRVRRRINQDEEVEAQGGGGGGVGRRAGTAATAAPGSAAGVTPPAGGTKKAAASSSAPPPSKKSSPSSPSSASPSTVTVVASMERSRGDEDQEGRHKNGAAAVATSAALISRRAHAFSSETWWMVDLEVDPSQGATRLVKTCMHAYGWDAGKARSVLRAYRQFLFLKTKYEDYDAKMFSPSGTVDMMWHQHILDVVNYVHDCALLCGGRVVGHDPRGSEQGPERDERRRATRQALLRHKNEIGIEDKEWKELFEGNENGSPATATATAAVAPAPRSAAAPSPAAESFRLFVNMPDRSRFTINITPDYGRLSDVYDEVASKTGIPAGEFRLHSGEKMLDISNTSLRAFGLRNESTLNLEKRIQICVRAQNGERFWYKVWPISVRLSTLYNLVSSQMGINRSALRLSLDGDYLHENTLLRLLELEDNDQIDAMVVQCGC